MNVAKVIMGAIGIIVGLVLLPLVAIFTEAAWVGTGNTSSPSSAVNNISGLTTLLNLVPYAFAFGIIGLGVGMIAYGFRTD